MLVSLIIPIYKVEAYIVDCLISVYAQTYDKIEVILVDDCSPDNSIGIASNIISKLQSKFDCRIIRHEHNRGLSAARNTGVENATGDYLYFLDSDDELTPDCIEILVNLLTNNPSKIDFVVAGFKVIGSDFRFPIHSDSYIASNELVMKDYLEYKWPVMACNKLINRVFFINNDLWFEEGLLHEDELFSFKLACVAKTMIATSQETYVYKVRSEGTITANKREKNFESLIQINSYRFEKIATHYLSSISSHISLKFMLISTIGFIRNLNSNKLISNDKKRKLFKEAVQLLFHSITIDNIPDLKNIFRLLYIFPYRFDLFLFINRLWFR